MLSDLKVVRENVGRNENVGIVTESLISALCVVFAFGGPGAQTPCSDSAKVASAEASLPIADRSTFERAGRFERTAPCVWPIAPYGRWGCI
jgi:hypothetical protein